MKKRICIAIILVAAGSLLYEYVYNAYSYYQAMTHMVPLAIGIEAGPVKVSLTDATDWDSVFKALVTVIGTYLGIKLVNKYVR
jgi:hypothetical protein